MLQRDFGTLSSRSASAHPDPKKPGDPKHFRLDERILKEYESRPPVFQHLSTNAYGDLPVPRAEPGGGCSCLAKRLAAAGELGEQPGTVGAAGGGFEPSGWVCGEECENRLLRIECSGGASGAKAKQSSSEKWANCTGGPGCGNRQLGLSRSSASNTVKVAPFMEEGRGWGLRVEEFVRAGQLVREYVGEVLDEAMLEARMDSHKQTNPNDVNM